MKRNSLWGVGIVVLILLVIGGVAFAKKHDSNSTGGTASQSADNTSMTSNSVESATTNKTYTLADVAKHNIKSDCWMVVSGNVYDVTSSISSHPGGSGKIIEQCGKDGTTAFMTQGGEGEHSKRAENDLAKLKIGTLAK